MGAGEAVGCLRVKIEVLKWTQQWIMYVVFNSSQIAVVTIVSYKASPPIQCTYRLAFLNCP